MLPKQHRITKTKDFDRIYKDGKRIRTPFFIFNYLINGKLAGPRFGFIASKKVGNAVTRNRAKRLLREAVKAELESFPDNIEASIVAFDTVPKQSIETLKSEMKNVINQI